LEKKFTTVVQFQRYRIFLRGLLFYGAPCTCIPFSRFDIIPKCPGQTLTNGRTDGIAISVSSVAEVTAGVELP